MENQEQYYQNLMTALRTSGADFKEFNHRKALTYQDLLEVQKEAGFFGTEGKCMVIDVDNKPIVYVTNSKNRVNLNGLKKVFHTGKIQLASSEELATKFAAEPGCAYPFGFDKDVDIYIDPEIFQNEWFLFSPVYANKTIQVKGSDLEKVFKNLPNKVEFVVNFNKEEKED